MGVLLNVLSGGSGLWTQGLLTYATLSPILGSWE